MAQSPYLISLFYRRDKFTDLADRDAREFIYRILAWTEGLCSFDSLGRVVNRRKEPMSFRDSNWRHEASKRLPEIKGDIEKAKDAMTLWATITDAFRAAYFDARNEDFIRRVYGFAEWCLEQERSEIPRNGTGETTKMGLNFSILNTFVGNLLASDSFAKDIGEYGTAGIRRLDTSKAPMGFWIS